MREPQQVHGMMITTTHTHREKGQEQQQEEEEILARLKPTTKESATCNGGIQREG